jgi:hypothetical protein
MRQPAPAPLAVVLGFLLAASSSTSSAASPSTAERLFGEAQRAFDQGRFEQAHLQFSRVADEVRSPNAASMAARSLQKLGRLTEAFEAMDRAVDLATERLAADESYRSTRDAAAAEREAIAAEVARVIVAVADPPPVLAVRLGGRVVETTAFGRTLAVAPGSLSLDARAPGRVSFSKAYRLRAGQLETVALALPPLAASGPRAGGPVRTVGFVTAALGAAALGTAAVTWTLAGARHDEVVRLCGTPPCVAPSTLELIREGEQLDLATNVALGLGVATTVAGATMIAVGWPRTSTETTAIELRVAPTFIGLAGTF